MDLDKKSFILGMANGSGGGGTPTDVQINGESIVENHVANLVLKQEIIEELGEKDIVSGKAVHDALAGFYIAVASNNERWGSVTGGGIYPRGTEVTLVATPATGCSFLAWKDANGNILSTEATYSFTPTNDVVIQAMFGDSGYVKIVPWATGSDSELLAMVNAHYEGIIDIHDFWSIGDTRTVHLSAMENTDGTVTVGESHDEQDVEWVLMDSTLTDIAPADEDIESLAFAVGMKDGLETAGYMNPTNTNVGGWDECVRRAWCNSIFKNSIPVGFRGLFKEFKWSLYGGSGADPVLTESTDMFALAPEKCIVGARTFSSATEAEQFNHWEWYQTAEHRIKNRGISGSANSWWESSPYSSNATAFCSVATNGTADGSAASNVRSLAPFGCI